MNQPISAAEIYASATGASNLRLEAHRMGAADAIGAAGMSPYRTGLALMRLQAEWDSSAKPKPPTSADISRLAASLDIIPTGQPNAGMVAETHNGKTKYLKPHEVAERTALAWHLHELGVLASHLKTLPAVRAELERWIGPPHAARVVADVLGWWLAPRCQTCRGCGTRIVHGTGGRSSGKVCWACRLSPTPGERPLPHSGVGRRLLAHIRACVGAASAEQGAKERRSPATEQERANAKKHAQVAKLVRADQEATADQSQDRLKVARHFGRSMSREPLARGDG